jgi:hypothetical protein
VAAGRQPVIIKADTVDMRRTVWLGAAVCSGLALYAQDAREIVRKSVELDQSNWRRMKDYTWMARETERHLDSSGRTKSVDTQAWETIVLYGEPHRRIIERDGHPLTPAEQQKQQQKLDRAVSKLENETPEQRQRRLANREKQREKDREFLREIPDMYDLRLEGDAKVDGYEVWVISATPKIGYRPKSRDAGPLMKIKGKVWIDKTEYQWVRLEAETTDTISFGLFLARLSAGAKLVFEQTRVNDEVWLPKREFASGSGRLGLVKKITLEQELTWSNYRKFRVESKVVAESYFPGWNTRPEPAGGPASCMVSSTFDPLTRAVVNPKNQPCSNPAPFNLPPALPASK